MMTDQSLPRAAVLIVNARSRKGRKMFRRAFRGLKAAGIDVIRSHAVRDPRKLKVHVCEAVADGAPMVIVGGGDGSLSSSVDHLVGHDTVFALLPLGTANSFARTLGIPLDLEGAIDVIATGKRRRIDLGMIDDDYYANCATLGIAPLIAETVPHGLKRILGRPGYLAWAMYQMTRFKPFRLTIGEGATAETLDALEVRVANGNYHGGSELVDSASVDSGEIVVQVVTGRARSWLAWSWIASILRLDARKGTMREFHGREIRIATDRPMPVSIDGELLATTPFTARIAKAVIEVAVPA